MKPAPFDYFDPDSLDEALDLLNQYGDDAEIIAGGQSLGPILNMRLSAPKVLVDLNRVTTLDYQREENGGPRSGGIVVVNLGALLGCHAFPPLANFHFF